MTWAPHRGGKGRAVFTDAQLLDALAQHATQAAAARALGVSGAAVSKRLKRMRGE